MNPKHFCIFLLLLIGHDLSGQGRNATWCFGDSAGIKFTQSGIVGITSTLQSQEACASISDTAGNLIFYAGTFNNGYYANTYNSLNQNLSNGDSIIVTTTITQGMLILPGTINSTEYLLFSLGFLPNVFPKVSLFLSKIDMNLNGGAGAVTLKNQVIDSTINYTEKMIAIKHGNGRDWWLINHTLNTNQFVMRLIANDSVTTTYYQSIGRTLGSYDGMGQMVTTMQGDKLVLVGNSGTFEVYDLDRCTGQLSNYIDMSDNPLPGVDRYYGASISFQNLLYYSTIDSIWQMNLNLSNPFPSKTLVYADQNSNICMGQQLMGPNGKIYLPNVLFCGGPTNVNDSLNTHLTVINQPEIVGIGCDVLPYFQPVGGGRCYYGLPNMPNYELGALTGSPCDTLTSVASIVDNNEEFEILPNPAGKSIRLNFSQNPNKNIIDEVVISDVIGKSILNLKRINASDELDISQLSKGLFYIRIRFGNVFKTGKFLKM